MTQHSSRRDGSPGLLILLILGLGGLLLMIGGVGVAGFLMYKRQQLQTERLLVQVRLAEQEARLQQELATQAQFEAEKQKSKLAATNAKTIPQAAIDVTCKTAAEKRQQALAAAVERQEDVVARYFTSADTLIDQALSQAPSHPDLREQKLLNFIVQAEYYAGVTPEREVSFEARQEAQRLVGQAVTLLQSRQPITNRDQYLLRIKQVEYITAPEIAPAPRVKR